MALNPEDVVKKSFNATHLRRGYDETQVDDFLDEVVIELRRLTADSDELRSQLDDCRASKGLDTSEGEDGAETPRPGATLDEQQLAQVRREREELVGELGGLQEQVDATRAEAEAAKAQLQEAEADVRARLEGELATLQERVPASRPSRTARPPRRPPRPGRRPRRPCPPRCRPTTPTWQRWPPVVPGPLARNRRRSSRWPSGCTTSTSRRG
jgi:DivIVA domain-containing protein